MIVRPQFALRSTYSEKCADSRIIHCDFVKADCLLPIKMCNTTFPITQFGSST